MNTLAVRRAPSGTMLPAVAYSAAWLAGLSVAAAGTDVTSTGAEVVAAVRGHEAAVAAQYVLTEVVAAAALALTVSGVTRHLRERATRRGDAAATVAAARAKVAALVAAGLSAVQGVLGLVVVLVAVPRSADSLAGALLATVNRVDGVKMAVLAVMVLLAARAGRDGGLPRWLGPVGLLLVLTITVSGLGYLLLVPSLALAAYASLPLLLVWVTGTGVVVALRHRAGV